MCSEQRINIEFQHRKRQAWASFHKYKHVLTNRNISVKKRLQFFECCVNPSMLYGLLNFPMTKKMLRDMDITQRKMLRNIIGWRRIQSETWEDTMSRMKRRIQQTELLYKCKTWSTQYAKLQWRYVNHIMNTHPSNWIKRLCDYTKNLQQDPFSPISPMRRRGHPRCKWDDYIFQFCRLRWPDRSTWHWIEIFTEENVLTYENEFVDFIARILE